MQSGYNFDTLIFAVVAALILFGWLFDMFVAKLEREGKDRGFTAFLVVAGVLVTVIMAGCVIGLRAVAILLVCFAASGLPMIIGGWTRYTSTRQAEERIAESLARKFLDRGGV